jgi:hypothetical protein
LPYSITPLFTLCDNIKEAFIPAMPYVTEDTIWPENTIPPEFKSLIQLFFSLADRKEDDAGPRLASEVFTSAASVIVGQHKITGSAGTRLAVIFRHFLDVF